jgi:hypothetical protein
MQMINITGGADVAVPGREIKLDPDPASVRMARGSPWEDTPEWERQAAGAVYRQVADFVEVSDAATAKLTREQKGRFVALCWIAQIHKHIPDPKPSYVADWDEMPDWQRETDGDIFEAIEQGASSGNSGGGGGL